MVKPRKKKRGKFTAVSIPVQLFDKIEEQIKGTGFPSVSSYVAYVLREVLAGTREKGEFPFTKDDQERVRRRLRALGYLE
jgi:Arc/MetJ-type ribon-helix-helix transcriptional regulator